MEEEKEKEKEEEGMSKKMKVKWEKEGRYGACVRYKKEKRMNEKEKKKELGWIEVKWREQWNV